MPSCFCYYKECCDKHPCLCFLFLISSLGQTLRSDMRQSGVVDMSKHPLPCSPPLCPHSSQILFQNHLCLEEPASLHPDQHFSLPLVINVIIVYQTDQKQDTLCLMGFFLLLSVIYLLHSYSSILHCLWGEQSSLSVFSLLICNVWGREPHCTTCGVLVPQPGTEPSPLRWKHRVNHWTSREVPICKVFLIS